MANIIENISPIINFNKLGFNQYAGIIKFQYLDKETELKVSNHIKGCKEIVRAIKSLNSNEFFINMILDNENELENLEKEIRELSEKIETIEIFKID
jgi:DNA-binding Lrp family transcriptional regulator